MEWFAFSMAMASFALVMFVMEQNKKLEKRIEALEDKKS